MVSRLRQEYRVDVSYYLRNLLTIVAFVDDAPIHAKKRYTDILRSQLTQAQQALLMLIGVSTDGEHYRPLIEEYSLLGDANLPSPEADQLMQVYHQKAFRHTTY